jgi:hypothetical protein
MKKQLLLQRIFMIWTFSLGAVLAAGFIYAGIQIATGNITSTAAFEF